MCKLLIVTGVGPEPWRQKKAGEFLHEAKELMCKNDKDGFGYALLRNSEAGWNMTGEKWVDPNHAFRPQKELNKKIEKYIEDLGDAITIPEGYDIVSWGENSVAESVPPITSILAHARMATCDVIIENTHPFYDEENKTVLIHNGVISNHHAIAKRLSSCDSEALLTAFVDEKVSLSVDNVQKMVDKITGSFACAFLSHDGTRWVVDIMKNAMASLYTCHLPTLGPKCYAFATTKEILKDAAKETKVKRHDIVPFKDDKHLRLDAVTGEKIACQEFKYAFTTTYDNYGPDWWKNDERWEKDATGNYKYRGGRNDPRLVCGD